MAEEKATAAAPDSDEKFNFKRMLSRSFLRPGFVFDVAFAGVAFFLTPIILKATEVAKSGQGPAIFDQALIILMVLELVALHVMLPDVFRRNRGGSIGFFSLILLWLAHFALHVSLAETVLYKSLNWDARSAANQTLTVFVIAKEFYMGALLAYCLTTSTRDKLPPAGLRIPAYVALSISAFILYTIAFDAMSHSEILEGIDPNIADFLPYRIFHFTFVFLLMYLPARLVFFLEDKLTVFTKNDKRLFYAGLTLAVLTGTWGLYTGPEVTPLEITLRDKRGQSELMRHIAYAPQSYLHKLIQAGIDVNACDGRKATALHKAVYWARISSIELLLANKADVNAVMDDGKTPLMIVFRQGWIGLQTRLEITELLLKSGADPLIRDKAGKNFLQDLDYDYRRRVAPLVEKYGRR